MLVLALLLARPCSPAEPDPSAEPEHESGAAAETERGPGCPLRAEALPAPGGGDDPRLQGPAVVVVEKSERRLGLYAGGVLQACWPVALAYDYRPGDKRRRGDLRTPEGWYRTSDKPWSRFEGAIAVHYPDADDARAGLQVGTIDQATHDRIVAAARRGEKPPQDTAMGGEILLHGGGSRSDWTLGCVALDDEDLDELRAALPEGMRTDVLLLP